MTSSGPVTDRHAAPPCPICGGPAARTVPINDGHAAALCTACDLLTTITSADPRAVNEQTYRLKDRIATYCLREGELLARYRRTLELLRRFGPIESLLEIGSNIGVFADLARSQGICVASVEINAACRTFQQLAYGLDAVGSLADLEPRRYDAVVLMDVLEHIPRPVEYLASLRDFLSPGGLVFLQFPNKNSWACRVAGTRWPWWAAPDHLHHFSVRAARRVAARAGYEVAFARCVSPLLDDLGCLPVIGKLVRPIGVLGRWIDPNPLVAWPGGSLIQAVLRPAGAAAGFLPPGTGAAFGGGRPPGSP